MKALGHASGGAAEPLSPAAAQLCGWALVAAVETAFVAMRVPWPSGGLAVRALHHLYDIGHLAAVGMLALSAAAAWERLGPRGAAWRIAGLWALAAGVTALVAGDDLEGPARRLAGGDFALGIRFGLAAAFAAVIPAAAVAGRLLARPRWRLAAVALAAAAVLAGCVIYPRQYPGLHALLAWAGATLAGSSLAGARAPGPRTPRARRAGLACLALVGLSTLAVWPSNAVVVELFRSPGAVVTPFWARVFPASEAAGEVSGEAAEWYVRRDAFPPVPPSPERVIPDDAIVFLLTIDALRADVLRGEHDEEFPHLARMRDESVRFSRARTTGSQTVYTITSLFSGTHFSQQYWSEYRGELWPHEDPSPRFPAILSEAGVNTVTFASAWWLTNRAGVVRGFDEAQHVRTEENTAYNFTLARDLVDATIARLAGDTGGAHFVYMHFMDPHYPYDLGGTDGGPFDRYVAEIGYLDDHLGRLLRSVELEGLADRAVFIITADHGEAFGEHDTNKHATTLYEEQLRVPLLVRLPEVTSRTVDEPVSTIDLGPTILDLFGAATPGHYMGQSLVPFLRGEDPELTRPIVAEGRLMQALVDRDGIKAIRDLRRNIREAYDLRTDRGELNNIAEHVLARQALGRLATFFDVHTRTEDGYEVPYRK